MDGDGYEDNYTCMMLSLTGLRTNESGDALRIIRPNGRTVMVMVGATEPMRPVATGSKRIPLNGMIRTSMAGAMNPACRTSDGCPMIPRHLERWWLC